MYRLYGVDHRRIDEEICAHLPRLLPPVIVRLDADDAEGAERACDPDSEQPDRPASEDHDAVGREVLSSSGTERGVHAVTERLHDRGDIAVDALAHGPGVLCGHHDALG